MNIKELRQARPELADASDEVVMRAVQLDYPDVPPETIANELGIKVAPPPTPARTLGGTLKDAGISALSGAVAVPEAAVGLADMVTGGAAGRGLEHLGFRPKEAKAILADNYSAPQKAAFKAVEDADGFMPTMGAALSHPSTIAHSVIQSLPLMGAGGVIGRALVAGTGMSAGMAAAAGEGVGMAGSDAEQFRQGNADGGLTGQQAAIAGTIGVLGGGIALVGAKVAKSLGIHDIDTMIVAGKANPAAAKGLTRSVLEGMFTEGVLEELPQSIMEQVLTNKAMGRPLDEGVNQQAVMGLLSGAAMGGGANVMGSHAKPGAGPGSDAAPGAASPTDPLAPPAGPITAAVQKAVPATGVVPPADPKALPDAINALIEAAKKHEPDPEEAKKSALRLAEQSFTGKPIDGEDPQAVRDEQVYNEVTAPAATGPASDLENEAQTAADHAAVQARIDEAAHEAATSPANDRPEPTDAQKEAGNYKKGHINWNGLDATIENPQGSTRSGMGPPPGTFDEQGKPYPGKPWSHEMSDHYGYFKRTEGADGEQVDAYFGPRHDAPTVFVIDQVNQHDNSFDEHKVMAGYATRGAAVNAYKRNFDKGWTMGRVTEMPVAEFKNWLKTGDTTKPASPKGALEAKAPAAAPAAPAPAPAAPAAPVPAASTPAPAPKNPIRNSVVLDARGFNGEKLGDIIEPHDGTDAGILAAHDRTRARLSNEFPYPQGSNAGSRAGATDENGNPKYAISPNGRLSPFGTKEAAYTHGDLSAAPTPAPAPNPTLQQRRKAGKAAIEASSPAPAKEVFHASISAAEDALKAAGRDTHHIVRDRRGLVVRPKDAPAGELTETEKENARLRAAHQANMGMPTMIPPVATENAQPVDSKGSVVPRSGPEVSKNTIVTDDAAAAARAILKKKLGTLNSAMDPELLGAGITLTIYHIEKGARTFVAYTKAMIDDMGEGMRPYLKSWYMAAKYDPRAAAIEGLDDEATVNAVQSAATAPPVLQQHTAPGAASLADHLAGEIAAGRMPKDNPALKKLVEAFDGKPADPARMKQAQEQLEAAIVMTARGIADKNRKEGPKTTFAILRRLYDSQPLLNMRTSTSVENQAYSTPAPLAFLASRMAGIDKSTSVLEPTAGTGMLLMEASPKKADVNEFNDERADILQAQGFRVSRNDASIEIKRHAGYPVDAVIANPPFGSIKDGKGTATKVRHEGYVFGQIDHLIAAKALATMKDDGKAVLILGANKADGGMNNDDQVFFNWLYANYNVHTHFEVDGKLYTRQGASWPVRVIAINGRQKSSTVAPREGTIQRVNTWEQVYEQYEKSVVAGGQAVGNGAAAPVGGSDQQTGTGVAVPGNAGGKTASTGGRGPRGGATRAGNVAGASAGTVGDRGGSKPDRVGSAPVEQRGDGETDEPIGPVPTGDAGHLQPGRTADPKRSAGTDSLTAADNQFQVQYVARSARKDEGVLIPVNMAQPLQDALDTLEDAVGDIDKFAAKELGYDSIEQMHEHLMGLQVDSVASAIYQIQTRGKAIIIADQTGIGKGRQAAAIIRWAIKTGKVPVFVTVKPSLFTDMFGDLQDIGTSDAAPYILNLDEYIKGRDDEKLFHTKPADRRAGLPALTSGEMPAGRNAVFMTYSQINVENTQRAAILGIAPNAVFILDESHNAGGESATGDYIKSVLDLAKGTVYLSATYAKRPDNMPLYFKTDMGEAVADDETLMQAMAAGGLPLQTVVSNNLVKAGQMFRRERSYDGVNIDTVVDTARRTEHEELSDKTTSALRAIVSADGMFHHVYVKQRQEEAAAGGGRALDNAGNQAGAGVDHTQFSSVVHNFVRQMLLGLKAQTAADEAIATLKRNEKPLIALENTMGSFLANYAADNGLHDGQPLGQFDYRTVLSRALKRTRYLTIVDAQGNKSKEYVPLEALDRVTREAYDEAQGVIDELEIDIPVSPIDWMRQKITEAGYSVAEITGRNLAVDYSNPLAPKLTKVDQKEQDDKVATTRRFNSGQLDALILNVSGSTGISLHASEKFDDQRPRRMIVAQAAQDINILMQMLGRIHRTGQVELPGYQMLTVDLPAERRPAALTSKKMKSLNANTSSNTESATSVEAVDMMNKYGDQVVATYLNDNMQLAMTMGLPTPVDSDGKPTEEDIARKATGRLALMPVATQKLFYEEVEAQYNTLIDYLNKTNQNDLEPRTFAFDAKLVKNELIFEGTNPDSPFGADATYGEYSVKSLGKPMEPAEIQAEMSEHLAGKKGNVHAADMLKPLEAGFAGYLGGLAEEQRDLVQQARARTMTFVQGHAIGSMFRVDINGDQYNAVVTNIRSTHKKTGNPFAMSKIHVTIALNGALRHVTVPATQFEGIEVSRLSAQYSLKQLFEVKAESREIAKIITGNLLGAYGELQATRGTIISFTKDDGSTDMGILLPKQFVMADNTKGGFRLRTGDQAVRMLHDSHAKNIDKLGIASRDGVVRVTPDGDRGITLRVPKSKAKGGKYFLDKNLRAITGDFATVGDRMVVNVPANKAAAAIEVLMKKQALYALPSMADDAKALFANDKPAMSQPEFKQGTAPASAKAVGTLQQAADDISEVWARKVDVVVTSSVFAKATPQAVQDEASARMEKGGRQPAGVFYEGRVYLFADRIPDEQYAAKVLLHEVYGHLGLHGNFGAEMDAILRQIATARPDKVAEVLARTGMKPEDRLRAAEEVLAEMAQNNPQLGFVQRAVAALRTWLRTNLPALFGKTMLTDDEIVRTFLEPARAFIQTGERKAAPGAATGPAFAQGERGMRTVQVDGVRRPDSNSKGQPIVPASQGTQGLLNFYRWFGDSKAVDAQGRPLVLLHGTANGNVEFGQRERGGYFTSNAEIANGYTQGTFFRGGGDGTVYPVYLSLKNPLVIDAMGKRNDNIPVPWAEWKQKVFGNLPAGAVSVEGAFKYAIEHGHDGLVVKNVVDTNDIHEKTKGDVYAVQSSAQIKSATGNNGQFDPNASDISFSQPAGINDPRDYWPQAMEVIKEFRDTPGKLNWWQKTFGTPYDLAQRNPTYKAVYDRVQEFLRDVSLYATEAADKAPSIIPKLESWRDLLPKAAGGSGKHPLTPADNKAVGRPVWEGTLVWTRDEKGRPVKMESMEAAAEAMDAHEKAHALLKGGHVSEAVMHMWRGMEIDAYEAAVNTSYERNVLQPGVVWTDDELKSMFALDARQIGLYREFHAAAGNSLNALGKADMLRFVGKDGTGRIRDEVLNAPTAQAASELLRDHLLEMADLFPDRNKVLIDTATRVIDKGDKIKGLLDRGYAPLSRFGTYTVDVVDKDGQRVYFGLFEGRIEARHMAAKMEAQFPGSTVKRGTTSQEEYKMFAGMSPETAELFGEMIGLESDGTGAANAAFQKWLKTAKSNRSAMKRLIERKGTAGFSEDMGRVLAGFLYSNARQTSQNLHASDISQKVQAMSEGEGKQNGELKDAAVRLMKYVQDPQEEAHALRGVLFAQYLGGSIAAMLVNMTQPFAVTMPYLSQYGGVKASAGQMKSAVADVWKKSTGDAGLDAALKHAAEQGIVAPQEVHQLMAQAAGRGGLKAGDGTMAGNAMAAGSNALARLVLAWGKPFSMAELFNRRVTFIAAYRTAVARGIDKPAEFAEKAVNDTQFVYNKGNKPEWGRGPVGSVLFTFKQYSISYLELAHRMYTTGGPEGKKSALFMLAMLMLMGGAGGLPFVDDVSDLVDGVAQRMGYNLRIRHVREKLLRDTFGEALGGFMDKGVSGLPGVPIDVAGRFGMGNLIPGTGLLTQKSDHTKDVIELAGPAGDFAARQFQAANKLAAGDVGGALTTAGPKAAANLAKAGEMATLGFYTDGNGKKVIDTDGYDAFAKAIGFQPNAVAQAQRAASDVQQLVGVARMRQSEIADKWAMAVLKNDPEAAQSAKAELQRWNENNPDSPIRIQYSAITKRVREMRKSKEQRVEDSAPRAIRAEVKKELQEARK